MVIESEKERILFMCIHNAARSQMAEGFFQHFYGEEFDVFSAGSDPHEMESLAIDVMAEIEIEIEISKQLSNSLKDYEDQEFDYVVTICGNPYNACPFFIGGKKYFKQPFDDLSSIEGNKEERVEFYRNMWDELGDWVQGLYNYQINKTEDGNCKKSGCFDLNQDNKSNANPCC
ncbi:MAG: arsenate reductase ArsC [Methanobacteriaceae archaeon]|nr:arsenate reductase ArsC [Methanobacteriaceae archaeon]MDP2835979.1 arsenate reductase ArsC [Methanobacteriaceae archaeon]MDP3035753.1 arsenate reductase ArsC [Methanobacteriaceae archaeon]MDP3484050.1 arsenate reductase ArsC [Methanobacteriaceae archaeon]MDP3622803.1 arsenate reductase ArsC [Methanobacteriaceae archaeon]